MKAFAEKLLLLLIGPLFLFLVCETGIRAYYLFAGFGSVSLERQLAETEQAAPAAGSNSGATETTLGSIVRPSADPEMVYELKPSISGTFQNRPFTFNSHGMRDEEYPLKKGEATFRIAAIGDSVLFGWGVEQDHSYTAVAEKFLNDHSKDHQTAADPSGGPRYEILNFGIPGYNTTMEAALLEKKAAQFDPDMILLHFVSNDWGVPLFMQHTRNPWSFESSYFLDLIRSRLALTIGSKKCSEYFGDCSRFDRDDQQLALKQYAYMVGENGFRKAIRRIGEFARERKIPVVIVYGKATKRMEKRIEQIREQWGFSEVRVKPYVDEYITRNGIQDNPKARHKAIAVSPFDNHPNSAGHRCYAEALLDHFAKMPEFGGVDFGPRPRVN